MCLDHTVATVREQLEQPRPRIDRRVALKAGAAGIAASVLPATPAAAWKDRRPGRWPRFARLTDLTYEFTTDFPVFVDGEEARRRDHVTIPDNGYYLQRWTFYEHTATHMDAPGHFAPGGRLSPEISPRELLVPAAVVDIAAKARRDPDAQVTVADLRRWERRHGRIPWRAAVLMNSGWQRFAGDTDAFRGTDASGTYHFPGFSLEAVDWLLERRQITSIGVDTLSLDHGPSATFDVHVRLLGADRYGLENLANLTRIPPRGAWVFVGLVPWQEGSGGPCRVIAGW